MSIASEIKALQDDKTAIVTSISNKGVEVPEGSGFDDFSSLIDEIKQGVTVPEGIGCVDLGTLNWDTTDGTNMFRVPLPDLYNATKTDIASMFTNYHTPTTYEKRQSIDRSLSGVFSSAYGSQMNIYIHDTAYTTASALKNSLRGVLLFYKKG